MTEQPTGAERDSSPPVHPGSWVRTTGWLPILVVALVLGSALRLRGIDYPIAYGPDQEPIVSLGLAVAAGDLNPHFAVYPGLGIYPPALVSRMLAASYPFPDRSMLDLPRRLELSNFDRATELLSPYYLADRCLTALMGIAIILLTFVMGSMASCRGVGALAALLTAFSDCHVQNSHFATSDIPAAFWTAVAAMVALSATRRPSILMFLAAGAAAGCALATKFQAGPALVLPLTAAAVAAAQWPGPSYWPSLRARALAVAAAALLVVIGGLLFLLRFQQLLEWTRKHTHTGVLPDGFGHFAHGLLGAAVLADVAMLLWAIAVLTLPRGRLHGVLSLPLSYGSLLVLLGAALAFVVASPYTVLDPHQTVGDLYWEMVQNARGHYGFDLEPSGVLYAPGSYVVGSILPFAMGAPAAMAGLAGVGWALVRRSRSDIVWLPFVAVSLGLLSMAPVVFVRYVLPLVPLLAVFAARAMLRAMETRQRLVASAAGVLTLAVGGYSFMYAWTSSARFANDTRLQAERAMPSIVPDGSSIALPAFANYLPSIDRRRYAIVPCPEGTHDARELAACGADYVIESGMLSNRAQRDPLRYARLYAGWQALRQGHLGYVPVAEFRGGYLNQELYTRLDPMYEGYFVSPTIRIYRRTS